MRQATHKSIKANNTRKTICQKLQFVRVIRHKKLLSYPFRKDFLWENLLLFRDNVLENGSVSKKTGCEETTNGNSQSPSREF